MAVWVTETDTLEKYSMKKEGRMYFNVMYDSHIIIDWWTSMTLMLTLTPVAITH